MTDRLKKNLDYLIGSTREHGIAGIYDAVMRAFTDDVERCKSQPSLGIRIKPVPFHPGQFNCGYQFKDDHFLGVPSLRVFIQDGIGLPKYCATAPLEVMIKSNLQATYTVYSHYFGNQGAPIRRYIGITSRGWGVRWHEHKAAARNGSPYLFHEAIRRRHDMEGQWHDILAAGLTFDQAMKVEEEMVDRFSLYPKGLNMIPGGYAGIRYLGQHGVREVNRKTWERRHKLIAELGSRCSREGRPNPLAAARWQDAGYAASVICSNPNNFSAADVAHIRLLGSYGSSSEVIADQLAVNPQRIKKLLNGETYSRVA
jgi:hypothetical protein